MRSKWKMRVQTPPKPTLEGACKKRRCLPCSKGKRVSKLSKGENNYPNVIRAIKDTGYDGWFGLECWPTYDNRQSAADMLQLCGEV